MASYIPAVTSVQDMGHWYQFLFKKRNNSQGVSYLETNNLECSTTV